MLFRSRILAYQWPSFEELNLNVQDSTPWLGVKVLVTKKKHPCKGQPAIVCDVWFGQFPNYISGKLLADGIPSKQNMPSGLKIQVQFLNYNPNAPFSRETFEYDNLIEFEYIFLKQCPPPDPDKHDLAQKRSSLFTKRILL